MISLGKISNRGKEVILEEKENGCLECISHSKDDFGYTRIFVNGKHQRLFRYLYEQKYGTIPKGMEIRHKCDNSSCCNVEHLEIGTHLDNINDMIIRGRYKLGKNSDVSKVRGTKNGSNKLKEDEVIKIFLSNLSYKKLAKLYNVSSSNIRLIKKQLQWKWLTDTLQK